MTHFITAASEGEHGMMLARCGMTRPVLGGQLHGVERDKKERRRLWQTGEQLPCPQVAAVTTPASCRQVGMGIRHCQGFQHSVRDQKPSVYLKFFNVGSLFEAVNHSED